MKRRALTRRVISFVLAVVIAVVATDASARTRNWAELGQAVREAERTSTRLAAGQWNYQAEQTFVDRLNDLADSFDRLASASTPIGQTAYELIAVLETTRSRYASVLERMQADVIAQDGDLEAVQDSPAWQQRELLAMRLLYRLNWLRYETAMRSERDSKRRTALLTQALAGFSEFLGADQPELRIDALMGHGLAAKALKHYDAAIDDFRAALEEKPGADMTERLRTALAESLLSAGRVPEALAESTRLIHPPGGGRPSKLAWFVRAKVVLVALEKTSAGTSRQPTKDLVREASEALKRLYAFGGSWRRKAAQFVDAGLRDPRVLISRDTSGPIVWLVAESLRKRDECEQANPLYDKLRVAEYSPVDVAFGRGNCSFRTGDYRQAEENLRFFVTHASTKDERVARAAYLGFKAAEALYARAGDPPEGPEADRYRSAIQILLDKAPDSPQAFEAWYRLGEWYRVRGNFEGCHTAFARVSADPGLTFEAHFLGAQCLAEAANASNETGGGVSADLATQAVTALDGVVDEYLRIRRDSRATKKPPSSTLAAKAALMAATLAPRATGGGPRDRLKRLEEFERLLDGSPDLLARARMLRIGAYREVADWTAVAREIEGLLAIEGQRTVDTDALKKLAVVLLRDASRLSDEGNVIEARAARRGCSTIYRHFLSEADAGRISMDGPARKAMVELIDRLETKNENP